MMMDFFKGLFQRLVPWYDERISIAKEDKAFESSAEVKILARDASRIIESYKRYGQMATRQRKDR